MIPDFLARLGAVWFSNPSNSNWIKDKFLRAPAPESEEPKNLGGAPEWRAVGDPTPIHTQAVFVCARTLREAEAYMADMRLPRHRLRYVSKESSVHGIKGVKCIMLGYWHYLPDSHFLYQLMRANEWQLEYVR